MNMTFIDFLKYFFRCKCSECTAQVNHENRRCCREEKKVEERLNQEEGGFNCITQHPGYRTITENVHVLEMAYKDYKTKREPKKLPLNTYVLERYF